MSNGLGFCGYAATYMGRVVAAGGTTPGVVVQQAIENLAVDFWIRVGVKPLALYPMYGGTAASHALNLYGTQYTLEWDDTVTHNTNGMTGNGVAGRARSPINPAAIFNPTDWAIGVYSRTASSSDVFYEIGAFNTSNPISIQCRNAAGNMSGRVGGTTILSGAVASSAGLFVSLRSATDAAYAMRNGVTIATTAVAWGSVPSSSHISIGANSGVGGYSTRNIALAFIASPRPQDATLTYNLIQSFQTSLARQV